LEDEVSGTVIVGLDVGGAGVSCAAAELQPTGLEFIGFKRVPTSGVRNGEIVNVEKVADAIIAAVGEVGSQTGTAIKVVYSNLPARDISGLNTTGVVMTETGEVTENDIDQVINSARAQGVVVGRKILHVIPRSYSVDGRDQIVDPKGMSGLRLAASVHVISAPESAYKNLSNCLSRAGLNLAEVFESGWASHRVLLHPEELASGVAMVDVGASTINISIFVDGAPYHTSVVPLGGDYLTNDLSVGLRTSSAEAEKIKLQAKSCDINNAPSGHFKYLALDGRSERTATNQIITHILSARVEEMLDVVANDIESVIKFSKLRAGVVLSGGSIRLPGFTSVAGRFFGEGTPIRAGSEIITNEISGVTGDMSHHPGVLGVVLAGYKHFVEHQKLMNPARFESGLFSRILGSAKRFFGGY